ncbi:hypothetical protein L596_008531 [Steinernema carpocapsae]|uniref:Uncharacterized protein n=1 Tax=Steinernema carpocapsae TaxID=34508 RepID=A0A4U5PCS6_STECR|nr:hypothetical protein L596_008531 [Steinernema carpocapsae]
MEDSKCGLRCHGKLAFARTWFSSSPCQSWIEDDKRVSIKQLCGYLVLYNELIHEELFCVESNFNDMGRELSLMGYVRKRHHYQFFPNLNLGQQRFDGLFAFKWLQETKVAMETQHCLPDYRERAQRRSQRTSETAAGRIQGAINADERRRKPSCGAGAESKTASPNLLLCVCLEVASP